MTALGSSRAWWPCVLLTANDGTVFMEIRGFSTQPAFAEGRCF